VDRLQPRLTIHLTREVGSEPDVLKAGRRQGGSGGPRVFALHVHKERRRKMSGKRLKALIAAALLALAVALSVSSPPQLVPPIVLAEECEATASGGC
jgi:hypothetical protein